MNTLTNNPSADQINPLYSADPLVRADALRREPGFRAPAANPADNGQSDSSRAHRLYERHDNIEQQ